MTQKNWKTAGIAIFVIVTVVAFQSIFRRITDEDVDKLVDSVPRVIIINQTNLGNDMMKEK